MKKIVGTSYEADGRMFYSKKELDIYLEAKELCLALGKTTPYDLKHAIFIIMNKEAILKILFENEEAALPEEVR